MNRIILCILFSLSITAALSQKVYFIYVQTESDQPFYVKFNDKLYTSTGPGYLILSNLRDTSYNLRIGFPSSKLENSFTISVNHKDHGFLLKNFGEKGWGLFDMQTLTVLYPVGMDAKSGTSMKNDPNRSSAFTEWLALAIDDPSIKEKPVYAVEDLKKVEVVVKESSLKENVEKENTSPGIVTTDVGKISGIDTVVKKDLAKSSEKPRTEPLKVEPDASKEVSKKADVFQEKTGVSTAKSDPLRKDTIAVNEVAKKTDVFQQKTGVVTAKTEPQKETSVIEKYKPGQVTKQAESTTAEGFGLVYVDQSGNSMDTIRILIPIGKNDVAEAKQVQNPGAEVKPEENKPTESKTPENTTTQTKPQENPTVTVKQESKDVLKFLDFPDTTVNVKKEEAAVTKSKEAEKEKNDKQVIENKETKPSNTYITIETDKKNKEVSEKAASDSKESKPSDAYITIEQASDKKKCPSVAGDNDFFLLRKRMASQKAEVDMLGQATKFFKTKCFTTYQIKNLSTLFLTDAAKFRFFDAAYAYVSDEVNFKTLESEMKEDYYITRFQAMIQHKNF